MGWFCVGRMKPLNITKHGGAGAGGGGVVIAKGNGVIGMRGFNNTERVGDMYLCRQTVWCGVGNE
jgi:hypothetical protein